MQPGIIALMTKLRQQVLGEVADRILPLSLDHHPTRVGIDGPSAAGKTTLADELAITLRGKTARPVLRVTIDHFKRHVTCVRDIRPARRRTLLRDVRRRGHPR
jgi:pantothenate kinase-related protein Tda10